MSRRTVAVMGALAILALVVAACAPAATPTPTEVVMGPVTITFWEQEGDEVDVFLDGLIAEFQEAYPNITVERSHYENEALRDQFQTASLAGAPPDVVRVPNDFAGPFSALDIIYDVEEIFDPAFFDAFFEGALQPAIVAGDLWGVPDNYGNHLMLLYNKSLVTEPPETTDALIEMAKELHVGDQWGFAYNLNEPFWLAPWMGGFGGWPLDENDQPTLGDQAVADALQFVHDLKFVHEIVPPECDYACADTLFQEGLAAMIINGDWSLGGYVEALGDDLGAAPIPKVSATGLWPSPMTSGKYWMISNLVSGDELEGVKMFIQFMTSADVQERWLEEFSRLPSNIEVAESPLIEEDPLLAGSTAQLEKGRGMPAAPEMRCAWDAMRPNLEGVMADTIGPADAAAAMQSEAESCIAEMGGQ